MKGAKMPKVELVYYTGKDTPDPVGYAARILAYTKNTRMNLTPEGFKKFMEMDHREIHEQINYMATTIQSSWEFVDLIFAINDISRSTAQQITRSRYASFAMQSQRVLNMSEAKVNIPKNLDAQLEDFFDFTIKEAMSKYETLVDNGVALEDAREVLPIGVNCNLIAKYNLSAIADLIRKRKSLRVQGPYVEVVQQMEDQIIKVWPWADVFFKPKNDVAISLIEEAAMELRKLEKKDGAVYDGLSGKLAKAADLIKSS